MSLYINYILLLLIYLGVDSTLATILLTPIPQMPS
jgi:hypothetical protein